MMKADQEECIWQERPEEGYWESQCGATWTFPEDGPIENGMVYCHKCGKKLTTLLPAWTRCEACDDFFCNIHQEHVGECLCPGVETWLDNDKDPYADTATAEEVEAWEKSDGY